MESMTLSSGTRASGVSTTSLGGVEYQKHLARGLSSGPLRLELGPGELLVLTVTSGFFLWNSSAIFFIRSTQGP